jgi:uncharacterized protein
MAAVSTKNLCNVILMMLFLTGILSSCASAYPDYIGYVNDYAHLLSAPQASPLNQEIRDFDNRTTIELAVVTVESLDGETPQNYATNIANYWGVGKRDKNNGIIFLVAMDSHDIWIEVGPGLADQFSGNQAQQIVDDIVIPEFRAGRPDLGIIDGVHAIIGHFNETGAPSAPLTGAGAPAAQENTGVGLFGIIAALLLIVGAGGFLAYRSSRRSLAKKNESRLAASRKLLDSLTEKQTAALEALSELKKSYAPSIWKSVEEAYNRVDTDRLELGLLEAERISHQGWGSAGSVEQLISEWEPSLKEAQDAVDGVPQRLADARSAQKNCPIILAGLEAAFAEAGRETASEDISMATRKDMEKARQVYREL